jgi:hypothetical protein
MDKKKIKVLKAALKEEKEARGKLEQDLEKQRQKN